MNHYSLLNRFQGAWLGSAIAKALSNKVRESDWQKIVNYQSFEGILAGEKIAQILSNSKKHERFDWQQIALDLNLERFTDRSEEIIATILPLVLFYHDNLSALAEQLPNMSWLGQNSSKTRHSILSWSYAIAEILREKLNFTGSLDSTILDVGKQQVSWVTQLEQATILLDRGKSLQAVVEESNQEERAHSLQTAMTLAWYCFLSSPENFSFCIRRAMNTGTYYSTVVILTGALAGAYNGITGIPLSWRLASQNNLIYPRIEQQSQHLLATWLGMELSNLKTLSTSIFAATGVLQPRSSLKIISQS